MSKNSLAIAYAVKKRGKMAKGGEVACGSDMDGDDDDMVKCIMKKRMSEGGMVANDTEPMADSEPAEFDDLALRDDLEFEYTGANSGDERGDPRGDDDDMVRTIMRSRSRREKNPRPA